MTRESDTLQTSVERILQSGTFRNSPTSRRLLKYLADHSPASENEPLKEYTIGVDAFGKREDYDPRQDSTVRIQMGRLRQKLSEYYLDEGKDDPLIVDLPKGQFGITVESRTEVQAPVVPAPVHVAEPAVLLPEPPRPTHGWRIAAFVFGALSLLLCGLSLALYLLPRPAPPARPATSSWTPELAELWRPFVNTDRPLMIVVGNPLFMQFENKALYRDLGTENPEELLKSPSWGAIRKALGNSESRPVHYYAAVGEVGAAFLLGQRLGSQQPNMTLVRSSQLQWQQLAAANVLFLGPPRFFGEKLTGLPVGLEINEAAGGFQVVHPQSGELPFYAYREPTGFLAEDGEACVLITHAPGPVGNTDVLTFAGNSTFGRVGAIDAFTDPAFARTLASRMRGAGGHIPQYFQVLLRVKYKGGVPTETSYLLHREIRRRN